MLESKPITVVAKQTILLTDITDLPGIYMLLLRTQRCDLDLFYNVFDFLKLIL